MSLRMTPHARTRLQFFDRYISEIRSELASDRAAGAGPGATAIPNDDLAALAGGRRRIQRQITGAGAFSECVCLSHLLSIDHVTAQMH